MYFFTAFFRCFNMAVKRKLAVKTLAEKCQALRDLENGISNKNVTEKYGVPKNTVSTWLKNKEKRFTALEKFSNKRKKVRESNYPDTGMPRSTELSAGDCLVSTRLSYPKKRFFRSA